MKPCLAWLLFAVICIYSALDVYQTKMLFDMGAHEANPLLQWLIDITGTWKIIIVVKWLLLILLGCGFWMINKERDKNG